MIEICYCELPNFSTVMPRACAPQIVREILFSSVHWLSGGIVGLGQAAVRVIGRRRPAPHPALRQSAPSHRVSTCSGEARSMPISNARQRWGGLRTLGEALSTQHICGMITRKLALPCDVRSLVSSCFSTVTATPLGLVFVLLMVDLSPSLSLPRHGFAPSHYINRVDIMSTRLILDARSTIPGGGRFMHHLHMC